MKKYQLRMKITSRRALWFNFYFWHLRPILAKIRLTHDESNLSWETAKREMLELKQQYNTLFSASGSSAEFVVTLPTLKRHINDAAGEWVTVIEFGASGRLYARVLGLDSEGKTSV